MRPFTVFLLLWVLTMSLIYMVTGITLGEDDYPQVDRYTALLIQNFRNGIGDISPPKYGIWFPQEFSNVDESVKSELNRSRSTG